MDLSGRALTYGVFQGGFGMQTIYLDHNATTPVAPEVVEAMSECFLHGHANPASTHRPGQEAHRVLEETREATAAMLGADLVSRRDRLIFTSGGTEANNLAIRGMAQAVGAEPGQIIISAVEHTCVLKTAEHLMDAGWRVDTLGVTPQGVVRVDRLRGLLSEQTRLVSVLLANHETGVLQPIVELAALCREAGVPMHTDAIQAAGKIPLDFGALGVAAMSVAAHKFHGPPGIGALIIRRDVPITPILFGSHHQEGLRPGTEPVTLAVGMLKALELWRREQEARVNRMTGLRDRFEARLKAGWPELIVHGAGAPRLPQTSGIAFPGLDAQMLFTALDAAGVACSVGPACDSGSPELSPTLLAMGVSRPIAASSLRFSLGATTTEAEIDEAVERILRVARAQRGT